MTSNEQELYGVGWLTGATSAQGAEVTFGLDGDGFPLNEFRFRPPHSEVWLTATVTVTRDE